MTKICSEMNTLLCATSEYEELTVLHDTEPV